MASSGVVKTNSYQGRYYEFGWTATSQSIADNATTITWYLRAVGGSSSWYAERTLELIVNGETKVSKTNRVERKAVYIRNNQTMVIPHNADGKKEFNVSLRVACYTSSVNLTANVKFTLDQIPRQATLLTAPNFDDEDNPTITYSNPAGSAVTSLTACISLDGTTDDIAYRAVPTTGSSYTFNLTDDERDILRNATTTSNTRTVKFYLVTLFGSTKYSDNLTKTLTIINANPTVTATVVDSNSTTVALTGDSSTFVKYYSNAKYTITATALKGASIKSYAASVGGKRSTTASGTINAVESASFTFSATDSRKNSTPVSVNETLINYVKLSATLKVTTPTTDGDATLTVSGNYFNGSFGSTSNTLTVKYRQKVGSGSYEDWITSTATLSGNTYTLTVPLSGLDYMTSYTYQAQVVDALATITTPAKTVRATPVFDWDSDDFNFNVLVDVSKGVTFNKNRDITTLDNDTTSFWSSAGNALYRYATDGLVTNQPNRYGLMMNMTHGNEVHQIWCTQSHGSMYHRGGNANGWNNGSEWSWRMLLDSSNYNMYCLPLSGGTTTGFVKLGNTVNAVGYYRFHTEWMGFYASCADAQNSANRKGWLGFNATNNFTITNSMGGSNITNVAWTTSSDRRLKTDIEDIPDVLVSVWKELLPKVFKWNELNYGDGRTQFGLIAQDVITAFEKYDLDYRDYGFVIPYSSPDDQVEYFSITYDSYHMLTAMVLRETNAKLDDQQTQINSLREEIDALKKLISGSITKSEEE